MKICLCQTAPRWQSPEENIREADELVRSRPGADLYVLPEMWATGFSTEQFCAAPQALEWMQHTADRLDCAVAGSLAVPVGNRYANRLYFVRPNEDPAFYDKRHLFYLGNEHLLFRAGTHRVVVPWRGLRFCLQTCYDLRFPVFARCRGDYDALLYVACWPRLRLPAWNALLPARAVENQCYVIAVNRTGEEPGQTYSGGSVVLGPDGRRLAEAGERAGTVVVECPPETVGRYRDRFPFLNDADAFKLTDPDDEAQAAPR